MKIPPSYSITPEILELIEKIDVNKSLLSSFNIQSEVKNKIQRTSLLKSSLFSARIEGNPLSMDDLEATSDQRKKREVTNILKAIKYIEKRIQTSKKITKKLILNLHKITMNDLASGGFFRKEPGAIFNTAGIAVYMSPPPSQINKLIDDMLDFANSDKEKFPLITAFISHLIFEKIHPFIDGNGRVGRLLILSILRSKNYDFGITIPFEEYLDSHREEYYHYLDIGLSQTNDYLCFVLEAFYKQTEKIKENIEMEKQKDKKTLFLPPRQEEIYNIIKDHKIVSLDFIKRRFLKIPSRTLRYDLKKMQDGGYIVKIGKTRGSFYTVAV